MSNLEIIITSEKKNPLRIYGLDRETLEVLVFVIVLNANRQLG